MMQWAVEGVLDGAVVADGAALLQEDAGVATLVAASVEQSSLATGVEGQSAGGTARQGSIWGGDICEGQ